MQISTLALHAGEFAMRRCGECGRSFVVEADSKKCHCPACAQKYAPKDRPVRVTFCYSRRHRCKVRIEWRGHCPIAVRPRPDNFFRVMEVR